MKIKKFLTSFVSIVLLCVMLSTQVLATGIGDAGLISGGASSTPSPGVGLHYTGTKNIVGYRFSVYATDGTLLGHPAEIMLDETLMEQLEKDPNYKSPVSL